MNKTFEDFIKKLPPEQISEILEQLKQKKMEESFENLSPEELLSLISFVESEKKKTTKPVATIVVIFKTMGAFLKSLNDYGQFCLFLLGAFELRVWRKNITSIQDSVTEIVQITDQRFRHIEAKIEDSIKPQATIWKDYVKPILINAAIDTGQDLLIKAYKKSFKAPSAEKKAENNKLEETNAQLNQQLQEQKSQLDELQKSFSENQKNWSEKQRDVEHLRNINSQFAANEKIYQSNEKIYRSNERFFKKEIQKLQNQNQVQANQPLANQPLANQPSANQPSASAGQNNSAKSSKPGIDWMAPFRFLKERILLSSLISFGEDILHSLFRPPTQAESEYKMRKKEARDFEKKQKQQNNERKRRWNQSYSRARKAINKAVQGAKQWVTNPKKSENSKKQKKNDQITAYPLYGAHHAAKPEGKDPTSMYTSQFKLPQWVKQFLQRGKNS